MRERDLWYKRAIVYALDVETFQDSNGDGIGDFQGLTGRLDYLATLGITCIWLLPFYPTPNRDNGYDVMDYYNVDSRLGTLGDFAGFVKEASERGMRVIVDLVINHTSDQHPWFQQARKDKNSKYRNYYTWREKEPENPAYKPSFSGFQESIWSYDEEAEAYYLHRFYAHQPDLNFNNPEVRKEIHHIMGFWLALGVSGFRIDAAHILVQSDQEYDNDEHYSLIEDMRDYIGMHSRDGILLAEASGPPQAVGRFFEGKNRMHMMFNFLLNQHIFLGLAREKGSSIAKGMKMLPDNGYREQWLNFLRHHDELNVEDLEQDEQEIIFKKFAPKENMRVYGRGIRRRLPPILEGNRSKIELAYSLLFSLPGTPMIQYGAEIGMGDDLSLEERNSVRTAMQWTDEPNAGFSKSAEADLIRPVINKGDYSYKKVNVVQQQRDTNSLLNWMERVIRVRRQCTELGNGNCGVISIPDSRVFVHYCELQYKLIAAHNLSGEKVQILIDDLNKEGVYMTEVFSNGEYKEPKDGQVEINPYGYRWFRLHALPEKKKESRKKDK
ncbi:alpha-amylase family protein [Pontibacter locisalis]|uniref:Alpha-amylase family protein n=1 Tax=Pontibacter locisalis TaxID=1719035 RepID=A0ABW5IM93_9BACT